MQSYVKRQLESKIIESLHHFPAVAILGPRQCGKSTLAKKLRKHFKDVLYVDLEKPGDQRQLRNPEFFFKENAGRLICLDEIQNEPDLFPVLRSMLDENSRNGQLVVLGSASRDLIRQSSETLAGRLVYLELTPFTLQEIQRRKTFHLHVFWLRGGFPRSFLAARADVSFEWRQNFIRSFLERDIPQLGFSIPAKNMHRLWSMCAHFHGHVLNRSKIAASMGMTDKTVQHYIDLLEQTFLVRTLPSYSSNLKKRLIKAPKIYIRDTGILHALLEIVTLNDLLGHPVFGASWEGFAIENILNAFPDWRASYFRTSDGTEIDLILEKGQKKVAVEFKTSANPALAKGFFTSLKTLDITHAWVVTPTGSKAFINKEIVICPLEGFLNDFAAFL